MADSYKLRVKIQEIGETEQVSENFKKRELIGVVEGEYPQHYKFEFIQGKTDLPDDFIPGTYATIHFNLDGRKVEKKGKDPMYFLSLKAWKIEA